MKPWMAAVEKRLGINIDFELEIPTCTQASCPQYSADHCRLLGGPPSFLCEPFIKELIRIVDKQEGGT